MALGRATVKPWVIWLTSVLFSVFQFYLQLSSGVIVKDLMRDFAVTTLGAGLLSSAYYYIYVTLQTPAGVLLDRFGARYLLTLASFVCGLGCLLFAFTTHIVIALLARLMMGTGGAFAFVGSIHTMRDWFPPEKFAFLLGLDEALGMAVTVFGVLFLATVVHYLGWRLALTYSGVIALGISVACWSLIRDPKPAADATPPTLSFSQRVLMTVRNPIAWINGLYGGLVFTIITVFTALWAIPFIMKEAHLGLSTATFACTFVFIGTAVGCPLVGTLVDTVFSRRKVMIVWPGIAAWLLLTILLLPHPSLPTLCTLLFCLGVFISTYMLSFTVANEIAPAFTKSTCTGFTNSLCIATAPLFQPLIGYFLYLAASHHSKAGHLVYTLTDYRYALLIMPLLLLAASLCAILLPEHGEANRHLRPANAA